MFELVKDLQNSHRGWSPPRSSILPIRHAFFIKLPMPSRPQAGVYLFGVRDPLPHIPIPLQSGEDEPVLSLNQIGHDLYDRAGYDRAVDYGQPPVPQLSGKDAQWAAQLVSQHPRET